MEKGCFLYGKWQNPGLSFLGFFVEFLASFFVCKACYLIHVSLKTQYNQSHNMNI